ncbi:MAG TPA: hypothetical protein VF858_12540 [Gemmatimonadaceae bacterium]
MTSGLVLLLLSGASAAARGQTGPPPGSGLAARTQMHLSSDAGSASDNYWRRIAIGFGISLFAHESAHVLTSLALGFHPHVALDHGRPTVFSGIDSQKYPHKQFLFSAAGLTTQDLINEAILDIPHSRGGAIERGILAGAIGTTLFYVTIGRNGSVSDIAFMARTSSLSKTQLSLIFGGVSAIQALRISRDSSYAHFFVRPTENGLGIGFGY